MRISSEKRNPLIMPLTLLLLVAISFIMVCKNVVSLTFCNPYSEIEATDPLFEVMDQDKTKWETDTTVNIFSIKYSNEDGEYHVLSQNRKENIIAPGTGNTYDFRITNTYTSPVKYTLQAEVGFSDPEKTIPIELQFCDYEANYYSGSKNEWVSPFDLNTLTDTRTIGEGKYIRYTLNWRWLFENGTDEQDTLLGTAAMNEDISLTVRLHVVAEPDLAYEEDDDHDRDHDDDAGQDDDNGGKQDKDKNDHRKHDKDDRGKHGRDDRGKHGRDDNGIAIPKTGDHSNIILWSALLIVSLVCVVFLIIYRRKSKEYEKD